MDFVKRSQEVFQAEIDELAKVKNNIGKEMVQLVDLILKSKGKVVFTGIGKTGLIGRKISSTLTSTGTPSVFMSAAEALHGDLGIICRDDVVIAISNSGSSQEILNVIDSIKKIGSSIVAITGDSTSELAKKSDLIINVGVENEASNLKFVPMCSTTAALVLGDALAVCLLESRHFKSDDFEKFHPGGALGRKLLGRVKNFMTNNTPKVTTKASLRDIVCEMSDKHLGMTLVYDSLSNDGQCQGIITDGDVRRAIQKYNDVHITAESIMTPSYKHITKDALLTDALAIMDTYNITTLAVTENKKTTEIIGIISIHHIIDFQS